MAQYARPVYNPCMLTPWHLTPNVAPSVAPMCDFRYVTQYLDPNVYDRVYDPVCVTPVFLTCMTQVCDPQCGLLSAGDGTGGGRNDNMSRLNGRVHNSGAQHGTSAQYQAVPIQYHQGPPVQYQGSQGHPEEFEPSCLVRTPSGNVYIPSDMPKTSTLEYKSGLHSPSLHSPVKGEAQKVMEGYSVQYGGGLPTVLPSVTTCADRPQTPRVGDKSTSGAEAGPPQCSWSWNAIIFSPSPSSSPLSFLHPRVVHLVLQ
ncbi:uncharacterized protein LOC121859678 [Homarus americanus]|uniref:uncharacterized protein LOC121859678 n=1 Tax=Homarus americanus TaxID=6706 RepID=UPI001C444FD9|nr:uncharacterized protein LOC121859678 [Homarus americanus]